MSDITSVYRARVNGELQPVEGAGPSVVDLFAGAGGLSLGFESAGFKVQGFEMDSDCCSTYNLNLSGPCHRTVLHLESNLPYADVLIGGPPCQPFSVAGRQSGLTDERNGFPAFVSAVRRIRPKIFIVENVRGVYYRNKEYINSVCRELASLGYVVDRKLLNAVDFGIPQKRERVFIVGHDGGWRWPRPESKKVTAGDALGAMAFEAPTDGLYLTANMDRYIANYEKKSKCVRPRDLHLDQPSRTLTCRNLAGATSDMMRIRLDDGRRRRLSVTEAARLQSFPDRWEWTGALGSRFSQIGNAVAPLLALALAKCVQGALIGTADGIESEEQLRFV